MAIRCGRTGHSHDTLAQLWACPSSGYKAAVTAAPRHIPDGNGGTLCAPVRKPVPDSWDEMAAQVPAGWFATPGATGNNDYDFWRVAKPADGRWAGRTFVSRVLGGHDDIPVRGRDAARVLAAILREGTGKAMSTYGQQIGRCGDCNRTLTDELSRQIGRGPVCRSK